LPKGERGGAPIRAFQKLRDIQGVAEVGKTKKSTESRHSVDGGRPLKKEKDENVEKKSRGQETRDLTNWKKRSKQLMKAARP